jgi:biopolymer transport protein ExbB
LRFSDPDGTPLPHVVERWDSATGRAEIWVRVPKVDGNSATDHVVMRWGNPAAKDPGAGAVFDRSAGFAAVWHLDEAGNAKPAGYADAAGPHPGTASAFIDTTHSEALIVGGLKLDGAIGVGVAPAPDLDSLPALTLSAWIQSDTGSGGHRVIVQKGAGSGQYGLSDAMAGDSVEFRIGVAGAPHALRAQMPATGNFHLIQATFDGTETRLYVDGLLRNSAPLSGALDAGADSLVIGSKPGGANADRFRGLLDEISVSHAARGPDWLKLAYETQKQNSRVVRLEPMP